jgi:hypothetical protein
VSGHITSNTRSSLRTIALFALVWNLVSAPLPFFLPGAMRQQPLAAVGFLFPVAGVGLGIWAVRLWLRQRLFGRVWFEMSRVPGEPGGELTGTIHLPSYVPAVRGTEPVATLRLTRLNRTVHSGSDGSEVRETVVWREELAAPLHASASDASCQSPVRFPIPRDASETTTRDAGSAGVIWVLTAQARLPGIDLLEDFDVPVYRAAPGSRSEAGPAALAVRRTGPAAPVTLEGLAREGIHVTASPDGGTRYRFGSARNVAFSAGTTAFLAIWAGALWLQHALDFPWIFQGLTGLTGLLLAWIVVDLWLGVTTVSIADGAARVRHAVLGLGVTRVVPFDRIVSLDLAITMSSTGRHGTPYYEIKATLHGGGRRSLGSGIGNKRHAEWLAAQMRAAIGLRAR